MLQLVIFLINFIEIGSLMTQFIDCTKKIYEPDQNSQASLK